MLYWGYKAWHSWNSSSSILGSLHWINNTQVLICNCAGTDPKLRWHWSAITSTLVHWWFPTVPLDTCRGSVSAAHWEHPVFPTSRCPNKFPVLAGFQHSAWPDVVLLMMLFFMFLFCFSSAPHAWLAETQANGLSLFCSSRARAKTLLQILIIILL